MRDDHRTRLTQGHEPPASPLRKTLRHLSLLSVRVRPQGAAEGVLFSVSIANIPNTGNEEARRVILELLRRYPSDYVQTQDFRQFRLDSIIGLPPALDDGQYTHPPPDPASPFYRRLKVLVSSGGGTEPVEAANIPANWRGAELLRHLIRKEPDGIFATTDYGELRLADIIDRSIEDLNDFQD